MPVERPSSATTRRDAHDGPPRRTAEDLPPSRKPVWVSSPDEPAPSDQPWRAKQRRVVIGKPGDRVITVGQLIVGGVAAWGVLLLGFLAWWRPSLGLTGGATGAGLLCGLAYSFLYQWNVRAKAQTQQVLCMDPGLKGCQYLLGTLPSWISLTEREKMEWLNRLLSEMWPYYDRGVCKMVKEIVEPLMEQYRPPIFKRIFFQELTFGEAPVRIEGIAVKDSEDEIDLEVDIRWCGDANISLGIDLPAGGEYTRLTPKVKDIVFVATLKIILKPLVEAIPGFAAVAVALKSPPIIKYRLDFGVLPGGITTLVTSPILAFVNFIVNEVIVGMLLWPKRFPVPILSWDGIMPADDPKVDLEVERLRGRQQGVVKVHIISAKELKSYDTLGKSDPLVEIFTTNDNKRETRVIKNSLAPMWDETFYLPVLEKDQVLHVEVFDWDAVNVKEGIANTLQAKGQREFMGRSAVPLAQFIAEEGLEDEFWVPLGRGDWTNLTGPGHGEGWLRLGLQYRAVENIAGEEIAKATKGLLLAGVIRCYDLGGPKTTSFVQVKHVSANPKEAKRAEVFKTDSKANEPNPRWAGGNKFALKDVAAGDTINVTVLSPSMVGKLAGNDELGSVDIAVSDIIASRQVSRWTDAEQAGYVYGQYDLGSGRGKVELELEFLPYW